MLDASPRMALGKTWLGLLKTRYEHNAFNKQNTFKVEPELSWFWMRGLEPQAHLALRYEADLAVDYGPEPLKEQWVYATALWHFPNGLLAGPTAALRDGVFGTSADFSSFSKGGSYKKRWHSYVLGLTVVWRLGR